MRLNSFFATLACVLTVGCAQVPTVEALPLTDGMQSSSSAAAGEVAMHAMSLLQSKYTYGGKSLDTGLDCSGLVSYVYDQALGVEVQGNAASMSKMGRSVKKKDLGVGDLVFFNTTGKRASHVGIYIGDGRFVHAENRRTGVKVNKLTDKYYAMRYEGARTLLR